MCLKYFLVVSTVAKMLPITHHHRSLYYHQSAPTGHVHQPYTHGDISHRRQLWDFVWDLIDTSDRYNRTINHNSYSNWPQLMTTVSLSMLSITLSVRSPEGSTYRTFYSAYSRTIATLISATINSGYTLTLISKAHYWVLFILFYFKTKTHLYSIFSHAKRITAQAKNGGRPT